MESQGSERLTIRTGHRPFSLPLAAFRKKRKHEDFLPPKFIENNDATPESMKLSMFFFFMLQGTCTPS